MACVVQPSITWSDRRCMSQAAYEVQLDRRLAHFKEDLESFLADKETFLEDFYRRLKEVLGRCKSWRYQGALSVNSIDIVSKKQIEELIHWDQSMRTISERKRPTTIHPPKCMLVQFVEACDVLVGLHEKFVRLIYKPLHDVFYEERIRPLARQLVRVLWRWKSLLEPGPLNHRLFSPESAKALYYTKTKHRSRGTHFNLVLRLIPDLTLKSYECLALAQEWRCCLGTQGSTRQMELTMKQWRMVLSDHEKSANKTREYGENSSLRTLETKLQEAEKDLEQSSVKLQALDSKVSMLESRIDDISSEQDEFRKTVKSACEERSVILQAVNKSKRDVDFVRGKVNMEQQQLRIVKHQLLRAQKRKCLSREHVHRSVFEQELRDKQERCKKWQRDLVIAEREYISQFDKHVSVNSRLNSARTDMDASKSQKLLLSQSLNKSLEKKEAQAQKRIQSANRIRGIRAELRHVNSHCGVGRRVVP